MFDMVTSPLVKGLSSPRAEGATDGENMDRLDSRYHPLSPLPPKLWGISPQFLPENPNDTETLHEPQRSGLVPQL